MTDRNARLLAGLTRDDPIVEIGPSFNPTAPKSEGWRTTVVDHADREALVAKYANVREMDTGRIEPVDVIWTGGPLHEAFPPGSEGRHRALIACHVLEHIPDAIGFLRSAERLLDLRDGVLLLALPDKRWCFDVFRPLSSSGRMIDAHRRAASRHGADDLFDQAAYGALLDGRGGWGPGEPLDRLALDATLRQAKDWIDHAGTEYVDCHAWQFTPSSFELLVLELGALGFCDWAVEWVEPRPTVEFLVRLRRPRQVFASEEALEARRLELLKRTLLELREMTDGLVPDRPPAPVAPPPADPAVAARLEAMEDRLRHVAENQLPEVAADVARLRDAVAPLRSALDALLPLRRTIARLRGRVP